MSNMYSIRSYKHDIYTIHLNKLGLSPFDDKRYVQPCGVETLAYGHYLTYDNKNTADIITI